ncbi:MAG: hypothetical protein QXU98_04770 [Candidatus Parvarchaeota archaeon]
MDNYFDEFEKEATSYNIEEISSLIPSDTSKSSRIDKNLLENTIRAAFKTNYYDRRGVTYQDIEYKPTQVLYVHDLIFCSKKRTYELMTKTENTGDRNEVKIVMGSLLHSFIVGKMFAGGAAEKSFMKPYKDEYLLIGRADYVIPNSVIEFKLIVNKFTPNTLPDYYENQILLYQWLSDRDIGYCVCFNIFNGDIKVFEVERDNKRIEELLERGSKIVKGITSMQLPQPDINEENVWLCNNCIVNDCDRKDKQKPKNR